MLVCDQKKQRWTKNTHISGQRSKIENISLLYFLQLWKKKSTNAFILFFYFALRQRYGQFCLNKLSSKAWIIQQAGICLSCEDLSVSKELLNEAECHRPASRLWAAFSRAAPRVANIKINMPFLKTMGLHQPIFTDIRWEIRGPLQTMGLHQKLIK